MGSHLSVDSAEVQQSRSSFQEFYCAASAAAAEANKSKEEKAKGRGRQKEPPMCFPRVSKARKVNYLKVWCFKDNEGPGHKKGYPCGLSHGGELELLVPPECEEAYRMKKCSFVFLWVYSQETVALPLTSAAMSRVSERGEGFISVRLRDELRVAVDQFTPRGMACEDSERQRDSLADIERSRNGRLYGETFCWLSPHLIASRHTAKAAAVQLGRVFRRGFNGRESTEDPLLKLCFESNPVVLPPAIISGNSGDEVHSPSSLSYMPFKCLPSSYYSIKLFSRVTGLTCPALRWLAEDDALSMLRDEGSQAEHTPVPEGDHPRQLSPSLSEDQDQMLEEDVRPAPGSQQKSPFPVPPLALGGLLAQAPSNDGGGAPGSAPGPVSMVGAGANGSSGGSGRSREEFEAQNPDLVKEGGPIKSSRTDNCERRREDLHVLAEEKSEKLGGELTRPHTSANREAGKEPSTDEMQVVPPSIPKLSLAFPSTIEAEDRDAVERKREGPGRGTDSKMGKGTPSYPPPLDVGGSPSAVFSPYSRLHRNEGVMPRLPSPSPPLPSSTERTPAVVKKGRQKEEEHKEPALRPFELLRREFDDDEDDALGGNDKNRELLLKYRGTLSPILPGQLYLTGQKGATDLELLKREQVTHILNVAGDVCECPFASKAGGGDGIQYLVYYLKDAKGEDIGSTFVQTVCWLHKVLDEEGGVVAIHCVEGVSRSSTLVLAFLMWRNHWTFKEAHDYVKGIRPVCSPNSGFIFYLLIWEKFLRGPKFFRVGDKGETQVFGFRCRVHDERFPFLQAVSILDQLSELQGCKLPVMDPRFVSFLRVNNAFFAVFGEEVPEGLKAQMDKFVEKHLERIVLLERWKGVHAQEGPCDSDYLKFVKIKKASDLAPVLKQCSSLCLPEGTEGTLFHKVRSWDKDSELLLRLGAQEGFEFVDVVSGALPALPSSAEELKVEQEHATGSMDSGVFLYEWEGGDFSEGRSHFETDDLMPDGVFVLFESFPESQFFKATVWVGEDCSLPEEELQELYEAFEELTGVEAMSRHVLKEGEEDDSFWDMFPDA